MPALSVLCPTRDDPARVRALLTPLRDVADEIVVVVDSRAPHADLGQYAAVADRVLRWQRGPWHSALAWMHAQCRGDWILSLAGDEVVSPSLLAALPELIRSRDVLQYGVAFRWVHPDGVRWLKQLPWHPDFHVRLMRNDATLRFAGHKHELAHPVQPSRLLDLPLWHLNLVVLDLASRRAKVVDNEAQRPGLLAPDGRSLNAALYVPEEAGTLATEPVPAADLRAIRAVLDARPGPAAPLPASAVPVAGREEIDPLWVGRPIGPGAYRARIVPLSAERVRLRAGGTFTYYVRVSNEGDITWPWGADLPPLIRVGFRWLPGGPGVPGEGRAAFPHAVGPGTDCVVGVPVTAPQRPGTYTLEVDVLHELVRWFGSPCAIPVDVVG